MKERDKNMRTDSLKDESGDVPGWSDNASRT